MALLTILLCIILLVLLVSWAKMNPFLAFLIVSIAAGLFLGIPLGKVTASVQNGIGLVVDTATAKFDEAIDVAVVLGVDPKQSD